MRPQLWVPVAVFLAVAIPTLLVLHAMDWGGDYRVWIALIVGGIATAYAQSRLASRETKE